MKIIARSFDFDGCLYNNEFYDSLINHGKVNACNKALFDLLLIENNDYDAHIVFIGSARQSKKINDYNTNRITQICRKENAPGHGYSCFETINEVTQQLNSKFDPLLLADIYAGLPAGTAISFAKSNRKNHPEIPDEINISKNKIPIIFAQIHKLSSDYPHDQITYDFYDDREDILDLLHHFFQSNPHLVPKNVTINLKQYQKNDMPYKLILYPPISGQGDKADKEYKTKIKNNTYHIGTKSSLFSFAVANKKEIILEDIKQKAEAKLTEVIEAGKKGSTWVNFFPHQPFRKVASDISQINAGSTPSEHLNISATLD